MMLAKPSASAWASATPGTAATSAVMVSGSRSRCLAPKSASITFDERTNASVLRNTSAKSSSKVRWMVSEKM